VPSAHRLSAKPRPMAYSMIMLLVARGLSSLAK
jgi:hypothetical protein